MSRNDTILNMKTEYTHGSLKYAEPNKIIFTSFSKRNFYLRSAVSQFVLEQDATPISPFMNFDYNLAGLVDKDIIRAANNTLIAKADELWVFGEVSDGVLIEIYMAKTSGKTIRYFILSPINHIFTEIKEIDVRLEDVSRWMWDWMLEGKNLERWHPRLRFKKTYPIVYPAYSKRNFYLQMHISQFCLENHVVPLNPFMLFRYFLGDTVKRETVYRANNTIVRMSDEVWAFGDISNGVLAEIKLKQDLGQPVKYYKINTSYPVSFRRSLGHTMPFEFEEPELEAHRSLLRSPPNNTQK